MLQDRLGIVFNANALVGVHLLNPVGTLIKHAVDSRSNRKSTANHSTETDKEAGEGLGTLFAVDDLHRRDVLFHGQCDSLVRYQSLKLT